MIDIPHSGVISGVIWEFCYDLLGDRGIIDLGIRREATVEEVLLNYRRRKRHRRALLSDIEKVLEVLSEKKDSEALDIDLWRGNLGYKSKFSTHETWELTREIGALCLWGKSIWFTQATPKFAFMVWIASRDRLSTMDRVAGWSQGIDTRCVL